MKEFKCERCECTQTFDWQKSVDGSWSFRCSDCRTMYALVKGEK